MATDIKKLAEELVNMTVLEVNELKTLLKDEYGIEAYSIVNINDIIAFLESEENRKKINAPEGILEKVYAYREKWGAV